MELFRDTHIDFMKYRKFWVVVSLILVLVGIALLIVQSLTITLVQLHIADRVRGRVMLH